MRVMNPHDSAFISYRRRRVNMLVIVDTEHFPMARTYLKAARPAQCHCYSKHRPDLSIGSFLILAKPSQGYRFLRRSQRQ
jgi:hypothetical protein